MMSDDQRKVWEAQARRRQEHADRFWGLMDRLAHAAFTGQLTDQPKEVRLMDDQAIEREIQAKGLTAPRVTRDDIDALMGRVTFTVEIAPGTTSTFVHAFLDGAFYLASGHSACVSKENFNAELGFDLAKSNAEKKARDRLWELEGYALFKRLRNERGDENQHEATQQNARLELVHRLVKITGSDDEAELVSRIDSALKIASVFGPDDDIKVRTIAKCAHEINRAYCLALGDYSQPAWEDAPEWQRSSAINGVRFHLANPDAGPDHSHNSWLAEKEATGWKYGPVKDPEKKEHPCFVPHADLPTEQKAKDYLFRAMVHFFRGAN